MSLAEILEELPAFSIAERQLLVRRAMELDEPGLSKEDEEIIRVPRSRSELGSLWRI